MPKFYLTTPIYYVNARPHIGHAYTTIAADVIARRHRLLGDDTFFLTGTDEHGQKIERSAAAAGIPPQQFADKVSIEFRNLWDRMGLTYDDYIRTTEPRHQQGAQRLFALLHQRGQIYLSSYTGQYSVGEEIFVEGPPGVLGPDGKPTETVTEENFFFRLSQYQLPLIDLIESDTLLIQPESRKNEILSFLRGNIAEATAAGTPTAVSKLGNAYVPGNLRDLSVSRSSFTWGIPVPEPAASETKQKHVIYVWLDALANYMTAVGYGSDDLEKQAQFRKYWPADLHIMGKEITRQHCIYWPAFLLAADLPLPKAVTAHGWLLFDDSKMSKSKGNIVRTETILDAFGTLKPKPLDLPGAILSDESWKREQDLFASDVLRYYLLREIPFGQDGSFSFDALVTRYNADLANGYGNLVSRTLKLVEQNFPDGWVIPVKPWLYPEPDDKTWTEEEQQRSTFTIFDQSLDCIEILNEVYWPKSNFQQLLTHVMGVIGYVDVYLSVHKPWVLAKSTESEDRRRLIEVLYTASEAIRFITAALHPILPYTTAKVWLQLGLGDIELAAKNGELNNLQWGGLKPGTKLGELAPIFPRAPKELIQLMTDMENNTNTTPKPVPSKLVDEKTTHTSAPPEDSTDPGAAPRTSALNEPNPGALVGGSTAITTARPDTPSHSEAPASGAFATSSAASSIPDTPQIAIDDFVKIDLRVAQIVAAERIPKADKLLRLEVDLGYEKRQILSGIAEWYTPEELLGKKIVVITNLAPRKMRGLESHGMLLAASNGEDGKPILATFGEDIVLGARLK
jgi:methionyl-tRNA synthetase